MDGKSDSIITISNSSLLLFIIYCLFTKSFSFVFFFTELNSVITVHSIQAMVLFISINENYCHLYFTHVCLPLFGVRNEVLFTVSLVKSKYDDVAMTGKMIWIKTKSRFIIIQNLQKIISIIIKNHQFSALE